MSASFAEVVGPDHERIRAFAHNVGTVLSECGVETTTFLPLDSLRKLPSSSLWRSPEVIFICVPMTDQLIIDVPGEPDYKHLIKRALSRARDAKVFVVVTGLSKSYPPSAVCDVSLLNDLLRTQPNLREFSCQERFWTTLDDLSHSQRDVLLLSLAHDRFGDDEQAFGASGHSSLRSIGHSVRTTSCLCVAVFVAATLATACCAYYLLRDRL